jgi:lipopolysaccharide export system protein LptA
MNLLIRHSALSFSLVLAALALVPGAVRAERADRTQPLTLVADRQGSLNLAKQVVVFTGNVVITKGTIVIEADRVEVREAANGYRTAVAIGSPSRPATFRQKRDNVDEFITGQADRIEYDERADTIRFVNRAVIRRLRGTVVADEIAGSLLVYDNLAEAFSASAGAGGASAANPGGRVRAVLAPRAGTEAAAEASQRPVAPAVAPAASGVRP